MEKILTRIGCIHNSQERLKKEHIHKEPTPRASSFKHKQPGFPCIILIILVFTVGATIFHHIFEVTLEGVFVDTNLRVPLVLPGSLQEGFGRKMIGYNIQGRFSKTNPNQSLNMTVKQTSGYFFIQDIVLLPDEVLLLVPLPTASFRLNDKEFLQCSFSDNFYTQLNGIDHLNRSQRVAAVRCQAPPQGVPWSARSVALVDNIHNQNVTETRTVNADYINYAQPPIKWHFMVYESFITGRDVVLFAKGINHKQGLNVAAQDLRCRFNDTIETTVTVSAQEVFRCEHPGEGVLHQLLGSKITLSIHGISIPSVVYYDLPPSYQRPLQYNHITTAENKKMKLCSCTMVFNVAKFIKEWVMYNSHVGVEHFFLYDNNSEDNLEETLAKDLSGYNVSRYPWPWTKTQEAGFSHCALMAREKCQWMMYTDVDEFVFSPSWLKKQLGHEAKGNQAPKHSNHATTSGALLNMILNLSSQRKEASKIPKSRIGQISFKCRNFGPSGLDEHPEGGVTQGYTCRERREKRYKSILWLEAASSSLLNVIHHFQLKKGYKTLYVKPSKAVINHYKYQAWSEFKTKFRRRVSAYVVDWNESRNSGSQDRTPGLGNKAIQPQDWENKFCEVNDTALKEYAFRVFSLSNDSASKQLDWQL